MPGISECESLLPVVFERELKARIIYVESVTKIDAPAVDEFSTYHHARDRVVEKICECVMTLVIIARSLGVRVRDVHERISNRTAEVAIPFVVEECNDAQDRQGDTYDRLVRIGQIVLHANIDRGIVHVVLNAITVDHCKTSDILLGKVDI